MSETAWTSGDRIRIRALSDVGSGTLLNGLTGEVIEPHPIAAGWYKIRLDDNEISRYAEWSAPGDELVRLDEPYTEGIRSSGHATGRHFP